MKRWFACPGCEVMWCDEDTSTCWMCGGVGTPSSMPDLRSPMYFRHDDPNEAAS